MLSSREHDDGELALADPSLFIAVEQDRPRASHSPGRVAVSAGTVGERRLGVLAAHDGPTRALRLDKLSVAAALDPLPIDEGVAHAWATLRLALRDAGKRMPINDSWIAATAAASRDGDGDIPGLRVIRV